MVSRFSLIKLSPDFHLLLYSLNLPLHLARIYLCAGLFCGLSIVGCIVVRDREKASYELCSVALYLFLLVHTDVPATAL